MNRHLLLALARHKVLQEVDGQVVAVTKVGLDVHSEEHIDFSL